MSLLVSEGHVDAAEYPLWWLAYQTEVAARRINQTHKTQAVMNYLATAPAAAQTDKGAKKAFKAFNETLESFDV